MTTETPDRIRLTRQQLFDLVDQEARKRLQMSGAEFRRRLAVGELPDSQAVRDIQALLRLVR